MLTVYNLNIKKTLFREKRTFITSSCQASIEGDRFNLHLYNAKKLWNQPRKIFCQSSLLDYCDIVSQLMVWNVVDNFASLNLKNLIRFMPLEA